MEVNKPVLLKSIDQLRLRIGQGNERDLKKDLKALREDGRLNWG